MTSPASVQAHLEKVTASTAFTSAPRLTAFLRFIVEHRLEGKLDCIQEYVIGLEVFGRKESFDPRTDSIVRVEAHRLRARLAQYYAGDGSNDPIRIGLPRRGYVPDFRVHTPASRAALPQAKHLRWTWLLLAAVCASAVAVYQRGAFLPPVARARTATAAVFPFVTHSPGNVQEYICAGMTDALITSLAAHRSLRVIPVATIMAYKNVSRPAPEIGRELRADYIVRGAVTGSGDRLRIDVQLVEAESDRHLWAGSYEGRSTDLLRLQSDLTRNTSAAISGALHIDPATLGNAPSANERAYHAWLKGKFAWHRWTRDGSETSIAFFKEAVAADPGFAAAHAWLSKAYRQRAITGDVRGTGPLHDAKAAAMRSLELNPALAEAHFALGATELLLWNWSLAVPGLQRALTLEPRNADHHHGYGVLYLAPLGRLEEAKSELRAALELEPASLGHKVILGKLLYFQRQFAAAETELAEVVRLDPNYSDGLRNLAAVYAQQGGYDDALAAHEKAQALGFTAWGEGQRGHTFAIAGRRREALGIVDSLVARGSSRTAIAAVYAGLGDRDRAFQWLDRAHDDHDFWLLYLMVDPVWDSLRADARFARLAGRIGLGGAPSP